MAFTVEDLTDLIAILEQRPEWRERLRQILLSKELIELPQLVERIAKAVDQLVQEVEENQKWRKETSEWGRSINELRQETNERWQQVSTELREMRELQRETIEWQRSVTEWQKQLIAELQQIREWQQSVTEWQRQITRWTEDMSLWRKKAENDFAYLKGSDRERYYRDKAHALFGRLVRRGKDAAPELMERLWDALKSGQISRREMNALSDADVVWLGEYERVPVLFVCEVSFTISGQDLLRAVHRAEIARKLGYIAVPVVAGAEVPEEIFDQAKVVHAIVMTDGEFEYEHAEQILKRAIESAKDKPKS